MNMITFPFEIFSNLLSKLELPIRISDTLIFKFDMFTVFLSTSILSVFIYFIFKVLSIEYNFFTKDTASNFYNIHKKNINDKLSNDFNESVESLKKHGIVENKKIYKKRLK